MCHQLWDLTVLVLRQLRHVEVRLRNDFTQFRFCCHMKYILFSRPSLFLLLFFLFLLPSFYRARNTWAGALRGRWLFFHWYMRFTRSSSWATWRPSIFLFVFFSHVVNTMSSFAYWFAIACLTSAAALFRCYYLWYGLLVVFALFFLLPFGVSLWTGNADLLELLNTNFFCQAPLSFDF